MGGSGSADSELMAFDRRKIPPFTLKGRYRARILQVQDGCTLLLAHRYQGQVKSFRVSLDIPSQYHESYKARLFLASLIYNKIVEYECLGPDTRGGCWLGRITYRGMDVGSELVRRGLDH